MYRQSNILFYRCKDCRRWGCGSRATTTRLEVILRSPACYAVRRGVLNPHAGLSDLYDAFHSEGRALGDAHLVRGVVLAKDRAQQEIEPL